MSLSRICLSNHKHFDIVNTINLMVIGNAGVGKTVFCKAMTLERTDIQINSINESTIQNFKYQLQTTPTIGVETYTIYLKRNDNIEYKFNFYDCSGQDRFRHLFNSYLRTTNGLIFVFDLNDENSFSGLNGWYDTIYNFWKNHNGVDPETQKMIDPKTKIELSIFIVGNKSDLEEKVSDQAVLDWIQTKTNKNVEYFKISSANLHNLPVYEILTHMQEIFEDQHNKMKLLEIISNQQNYKISLSHDRALTVTSNKSKQTLETNATPSHNKILEHCCT